MQPRATVTEPDVEFRVAAFERDAALLGHTTIRARAAFLNCGHGYYWRVATGRVDVGTSFIARVLNADWPFGQPSFDRYFRVTGRPEEVQG